jgi:hypothetical protein
VDGRIGVIDKASLSSSRHGSGDRARMTLWELFVNLGNCDEVRHFCDHSADLWPIGQAPGLADTTQAQGSEGAPRLGFLTDFGSHLGDDDGRHRGRIATCGLELRAEPLAGWQTFRIDAVSELLNIPKFMYFFMIRLLYQDCHSVPEILLNSLKIGSKSLEGFKTAT